MKLKIRKKEALDCAPKFLGWVRDDYERSSIPEISPMLCKEYDEKYLKKYPGEWIAQDKLDGHRAICVVTPEGNRFFSRRISKVTGWYSENTDCVPHLRDAKLFAPMWSVFDGELLFDWNCTSKDVQSVTGALPEKAIAHQLENGFLQYNIFDMISFGMSPPMCENYRDRLFFLNDIKFPEGFQVVKPYYWKPEYGENFRGLLEQLWEEGKEGLVLKNLDSKYEQGKRSPQWLKLKECKTFDVIITGFQEPTKMYDGKTLTDKGYWDYWVCYDDPDFPIHERMRLEDAGEYMPVTKPYAMGWIGSIEFGLLKDGEVVKIAEAKGITDADQDYIMKNQKDLIGTVIEVKAQGIIDPKTNSLRHPRFKQFRPDKNPSECKWEGFGD